MKVSPAIVTVPNRDAVAEVAATFSDTMPLPVPVAPAVTVIQLALLVAVRAHPVVPVIVTVTGPPAAPRLWYAGDKLKGPHVTTPDCVGATPACVTVKVWPPMVTVPVRTTVVAFAATLSATEPLPVPVAPLVTAIQLALLVAVRAHPAVPFTVIDTAPPAVPTLCAVGDRLNAPHVVAGWVVVVAPV